jgi:GxxExxY protein
LTQQHSLNVIYDGVVVGEYVADLVVNSDVLIEMKVVKELDNMHKAQCINYLKATGLKVCLQIKRITNNFICEA